METAIKTMKTPAEILAERSAGRAEGRLAHTPNGRGEFSARFDCHCYTCRDVLDPTGQEDAKNYNIALIAGLCEETSISQPSLLGALEHSTAAYENHHPPPAALLPIPNLPPPPPITHGQPATSTNSGAMSPLMGILTPRSISEPSGIEDRTLTQEKGLAIRLNRMLRMYQQLQAHIEELTDQENLSHDEMAAYDTWWNQVDAKVYAVEKLLKLLEE